MKKNIVISILVVLVLAMGMFIYLDKYDVLHKSKNTTIEEKNDKEVNEYSIDDARILIEKYYGMDDYTNIFNYTLNSLDIERIKNYVVYNNLSIADFEDVTIDGIEGMDCSPEVFNESNVSCKYTKKDNIFFDKTSKLIKYSKANTIYKKLYGNNLNITKEELEGKECNYYYYIESNDSYVKRLPMGCSQGSYGGFVKSIYEVKEAKIEDEKLNIYVSYIFISDANEFGLGGSINGKIEKFTNEEISNTSEFLKNHSSDLDVYKVVFTNEDGIYKFTSIEKE